VIDKNDIKREDKSKNKKSNKVKPTETAIENGRVVRAGKIKE